LPHSSGLTLALAIAGIVLTLSPLIVWFLEKQSWHRATVATAWVSYTWMGYLFLFFCIGLLFDFGHALATLLNFKWFLNESLALRTVCLLALVALGYGYIDARQIQVEEINIITPSSLPAALPLRKYPTCTSASCWEKLFSTVSWQGARAQA